MARNIGTTPRSVKQEREGTAQLFHVKHLAGRALLPDTEVRKYYVQQVFDVDPTRHPAQGPDSKPQILGHEFGIHGCCRTAQSVGAFR